MFEKDTNLAEIIGIILGDGSIPKNKRRVRITLNKSEEPNYIQYVYDLLEKVFKKKSNIYEPLDADAIKLTINSKEIVEMLIELGLKPGDKKINQVYVPKWIKENNIYQKYCLRGLVDTDGSIHFHKHGNRIRISFKNASYPLVEDFKEICEENEIKTGNIYPVKNQNTFDLKIETKQDVCKFIYRIQPVKWKVRAFTIGLVLKSINNPEKIVNIEKELYQKYPDKRVHYSQEYTNFLKQLCEKYGYNTSNESIIKEIRQVLSYNNKYTKITELERNLLNSRVEKLVKKLRIR